MVIALFYNKYGQRTVKRVCVVPFQHSLKYRTWITTHTYHLTALFPGLPGWAGTRKVKPIWILLKQETVSGSGVSWAICKSAPRSRQITTPTPHRSVFLQAGCPSCRPTNSVKALKAKAWITRHSEIDIICQLDTLPHNQVSVLSSSKVTQCKRSWKVVENVVEEESPGGWFAKYLTIILRLSYDNGMPKLRSTYDRRLIY